MKIALMQQHAAEDRAENLARALHNMRLAAERGAQMVVFPEVALTGATYVPIGPKAAMRLA